MRRITIKDVDPKKAISAEGQVGEYQSKTALTRYYLMNQGRASNFFVALLGKKTGLEGGTTKGSKQVEFRRHWARRNRYRTKEMR